MKCRQRSGLGPGAVAGLPNAERSGRQIWPEQSFSAHRYGGCAYRLDDVLVACAAAQVRRQYVEQIVIADIGLALAYADRQHQKTRGTEAALQAVVVHEGLLHR